MRTTVTYDGVTYAPGARFRVIREGLKLTGLVPEAEYTSTWRGWGQDLHPGDILTCTGYGPGWGGDPGYGVEWSTSQSEAAGAISCDIHPFTGGVFSYRPPPGYLEPIPGEDAA